MPALAGGLAGFILLRFLMGLAECGNYTAGIKALAGLFPGRDAVARRRLLQRGRAVRIGHRAAAILVFLDQHLQFGWQMALRHPGAARAALADPVAARSFPTRSG